MKIKTKTLKKLVAVLCAATMAASGAVASVGAAGEEQQHNTSNSVVDSDKYKNANKAKKRKMLNADFHKKKLKRQAKAKWEKAKAEWKEKLAKWEESCNNRKAAAASFKEQGAKWREAYVKLHAAYNYKQEAKSEEDKALAKWQAAAYDKEEGVKYAEKWRKTLNACGYEGIALADEGVKYINMLKAWTEYEETKDNEESARNAYKKVCENIRQTYVKKK